jgi:hypothetical protein
MWHANDGRDEKALSLLTLILQMALGAVAFMIVLAIMALVVPLWQLTKWLLLSDPSHSLQSSNPGSCNQPRRQLRWHVLSEGRRRTHEPAFAMQRSHYKIFRTVGSLGHRHYLRERPALRVDRHNDSA